MEEIKIFVPGRICLLGGLSDLVANYLSQNNSLIPGEAIACGINKGIYATVSKCNVIDFKMNDKKIKLDINEKSLLKEAQSGSFYSYIAGATLYLLRNYKEIKGLRINIDYMDLPIQKGLSSSAAICVLVVKAFNELYNLKMSLDDIREFAYEGEHLALSKCGRLDQVCALGKELVRIVFYENYATTEKINVKGEFNFVIVDLKAKKDTRKIMTDLNNCFPFIKSEEQKAVHEMMGIKNKKLVERAKFCLENENKEELGNILKEAQLLIDKMSVVCSELEAPILHKTLSDKKIQQLSYGGKGMGSGGDGSVQILARDKQCQELLIDYINNTLEMDAFKVDIK